MTFDEFISHHFKEESLTEIPDETARSSAMITIPVDDTLNCSPVIDPAHPIETSNRYPFLFGFHQRFAYVENKHPNGCKEFIISGTLAHIDPDINNPITYLNALIETILPQQNWDEYEHIAFMFDVLDGQLPKSSANLPYVYKYTKEIYNTKKHTSKLIPLIVIYNNLLDISQTLNQISDTSKTPETKIQIPEEHIKQSQELAEILHTPSLYHQLSSEWITVYQNMQTKAHPVCIFSSDSAASLMA